MYYMYSICVQCTCIVYINIICVHIPPCIYHHAYSMNMHVRTCIIMYVQCHSVHCSHMWYNCTLVFCPAQDLESAISGFTAETGKDPKEKTFKNLTYEDVYWASKIENPLVSGWYEVCVCVVDS